MLLVPAVLLALLCVWIVIPPFNEPTIVLAVASIELSPYLLAANALFLALTVWTAGRRGTAAAVVFAANCIVCALPLLALIRSDALQPAAYRIVNVPISESVIAVRLGTLASKIRAYLPAVPRRTPAIFAIYGGAWRSGSPRSDAALNRALAHQGYAVFALDYRHAPAYRFPAALDDVRFEISLIRKNALRYHIDTQRMAVLGHSSGGELAELMAFAPKSPVAALVSYSGAVDLSMGWKYPPVPDPIGVRQVIQNYVGDTPAGAPGRYRAASPLASVRRGLPPTLLIYGARDHVVDIRYARKFRDALRAAGTNVTFLELPWTEHAFEVVPFGLHAPIAFRATLSFLAATVGSGR
ncbi:MAG: alpha/beta hydrolase [Candidatus Cybelea sp.]